MLDVDVLLIILYNMPIQIVMGNLIVVINLKVTNKELGLFTKNIKICYS